MSTIPILKFVYVLTRKLCLVSFLFSEFSIICHQLPSTQYHSYKADLVSVWLNRKLNTERILKQNVRPVCVEIECGRYFEEFN